MFPRFASAVDVPLFLKATAQSTNGDGRWFYHDLPKADGAATSAEAKHLLECAIGGQVNRVERESVPYMNERSLRAANHLSPRR
jgi:hypothetical protein